MVEPAYRLWQAPQRSTGNTREAGKHDRPCRIRPELVRVYHASNEQRTSMPLPYMDAPHGLTVAFLDVVPRTVRQVSRPYRITEAVRSPVSWRVLHVRMIECACRFITKTGRETAEDATQIFGGRGITVTGMGKLVENVSEEFIVSTSY